MKDNDDHIDELARNEINAMQFDFKESYWDEMEAMLDGEPKKKRFIWWWFAGAAAVLTVAGAVIWYSPFSKVKNNQITLTEENHQITNQENTAVVENERVKEKQLQVQAEKKEVSTEIVISEGVSSDGADHKDSPDKEQSGIYANKSDWIDDQQQEAEVKQSQSVRETDSDVYGVQGTKETEGHVTPDEMNNYSVDVLPVRKIGGDSKEASDPVSVASTPVKHQWITGVALTGTLGYGTNFQGGSGQGRGMSGSLGLDFTMEYRKFSFKTGLSFGFSSIKGYDYREERIIYGLESVIAINEVKYNSLLTAELPLMIGYSGRKHSFHAGVGINFLLNANGRVTAWDKSVNGTNEWGYSNSLRDSWMVGSVEYGYRIATRWKIGVKCTVDLTKRGQLPEIQGGTKLQMWTGAIKFSYLLN